MYEKEGNIFAKLKSTIMIIGQRDSEAREVERAEERKAEIVQKKREQERETYAMLTNGRE